MKNNAKTVYNSLRIREGKTINTKIVPEDQALKTGSIENARELGGYINKSGKCHGLDEERIRFP